MFSEFVPFKPGVKEIVHTKMEIQSSFTVPPLRVNVFICHRVTHRLHISMVMGFSSLWLVINSCHFFSSVQTWAHWSSFIVNKRVEITFASFTNSFFFIFITVNLRAIKQSSLYSVQMLWNGNCCYFHHCHLCCAFILSRAACLHIYRNVSCIHNHSSATKKTNNFEFIT